VQRFRPESDVYTARALSALTVRALDPTTWEAFDRLIEGDGGVWGGCWCIGFHMDPEAPKGQLRPHRENKERLVREGRAQAALVFDGDACVGWCQFGRTAELCNIKHRKQYFNELEGSLPDWRLTCFYVGKRHRKRGVARLALAGAVAEIARLGGGTAEGYPESVEGRKTSSSFLYGGTLAMFEREGFERVRRLGMHHWVVSRTI
jgi:GNAT superfamily N-acetyltransferase